MRLEHLARGASVLAIGLVVEIAPANRRDVQDRSECEKEKEERTTERRRLEAARREEYFLETESRITGGHLVRLSLAAEISLAGSGCGNHGRWRTEALPIFRQPEQLRLRHLDNRQRLPAICDERVVAQSLDLECAPKTDSLHVLKPALDPQAIAELGGAAMSRKMRMPSQRSNARNRIRASR